MTAPPGAGDILPGESRRCLHRKTNFNAFGKKEANRWMGTPQNISGQEPDGGADLRLSLPLDCFWEAPGYDSGITVRLSQEGASVRRLTTVRFLEFEARFRRAFLPAVSDEQFCGHCVTEELWHAFSCRLCPFLEGEAAEQAFDRRSHPSVLGLYHLRFSEFYRFDFRPPRPAPSGNCRHL